MGKIIVLKTEGKGTEGVDFITIETFDDINSANAFVKENTKYGKYWSFAEIVNTGERLEICYMENI
jgi:S-methylmethionine-dependent homocysteine/selenocysteine methylase